MNTKIYTSEDYRNFSFLRSAQILFKNISEYGTLIKWLTKVGLTQQYKRSFLGVAWLFISPVFSIFIWVLLKNTGMLNPGDTKIPYIAYVFLSNALWSFFISFYKSISETYTGRGAELLNNNFPHVIIVIEKIIISVVNFAIPIGLSILLLLYFGISFSFTSLFFPFALIPLLFLGTGLGLIFSILKIVAVDLTTFFDNSLEFLKYVTPVVFASTINNSVLQLIMKYNPLTYLISFPRSVLLNQGFPDLNAFLLCSLGAFLFLVFAFRFFSTANQVVFEKVTL
jgi:lipopolysaccharide transport system permease protein